MTIDATTVWIVVAVLSLGTYALRSSFLLGIDRVGGIPPTLERVLPFVPTAALAALIAPNLLVVDGSVALTPGNERLLAGAVGFAVAWYTESILVTVGIGMAALWLLQWF